MARKRKSKKSAYWKSLQSMRAALEESGKYEIKPAKKGKTRRPEFGGKRTRPFTRKKKKSFWEGLLG